MKLIKLLILFALIGGCSSSSEESFDYTNSALGWSIKIPSGWKKNDLSEVIANNDAGIKAMEEALESNVDLNKMNNSLNFQKDASNVFQSVYEPFEEVSAGLWKQNNAAVKKLFVSVYEDQGIEVDTTSTEIETISGVDFRMYEIAMRQDGEVKMNQIFYSTYLNGYDFGVCLSFNTDENRKELLDIWRRSKFD